MPAGFFDRSSRRPRPSASFFRPGSIWRGSARPGASGSSMTSPLPPCTASRVHGTTIGNPRVALSFPTSGPLRSFCTPAMIRFFRNGRFPSRRSGGIRGYSPPSRHGAATSASSRGTRPGPSASGERRKLPGTWLEPLTPRGVGPYAFPSGNRDPTWESRGAYRAGRGRTDPSRTSRGSLSHRQTRAASFHPWALGFSSGPRPSAADPRPALASLYRPWRSASPSLPLASRPFFILPANP